MPDKRRQLFFTTLLLRVPGVLNHISMTMTYVRVGGGAIARVNTRVDGSGQCFACNIVT